MQSVIAHYQEIALKGRNRPWFLRRLIRNLHTLLSDLDVREIRTPMGRIEILLKPVEKGFKLLRHMALVQPWSPPHRMPVL